MAKVEPVGVKPIEDEDQWAAMMAGPLVVPSAVMKAHPWADG